MENNLKKNICVYIYVLHFAVHLKLTQYCKSTILKFQKKNMSLMSTVTAMRQTWG